MTVYLYRVRGALADKTLLLASVGWTEGFDEARRGPGGRPEPRREGMRSSRALVARGSIASYDADVIAAIPGRGSRTRPRTRRYLATEPNPRLAGDCGDHRRPTS